MKVGVVGAGGAGGYFAARWWEAGIDVTLIARGRHLESTRRVVNRDDDFRVAPAVSSRHDGGSWGDGEERNRSGGSMVEVDYRESPSGRVTVEL